MLLRMYNKKASMKVCSAPVRRLQMRQASLKHRKHPTQTSQLSPSAMNLPSFHQEMLKMKHKIVTMLAMMAATTLLFFSLGATAANLHKCKAGTKWDATSKSCTAEKHDVKT